MKRTFADIWKKEPELLHETSLHRFRTNDDVNQWLAIWWQVAGGTFSPYVIDNIVEDVNATTVDALCNIITSKSHDMICVNDPAEDVDVEALSVKLKTAFESILPEKSSFEK